MPLQGACDGADPIRRHHVVRPASLLADLATISRTTCKEAITGATFTMTTTPTAAQRHALGLLDIITV